MKKVIFTVTAAMVLSALVLALPLSDGVEAKVRVHRDYHHDYSLFNSDDVSVDFERDGTLVIECEDNDEIVEITDDYDLIVNGKKVKLSGKQQKLVRDYYDTLDEITETAKELGIEGAKIGMEGARIGIHAIACVARLLSEDYDGDDLEEEMERESKKIERRAEKLEKRAEKLEEMAEDFEDLHEELRSSVEELDKLGWF